MILPRIFRRARPAPQHRLDPHEVAIYRWHHFTESEWRALTNPERAQLRSIYLKVRMP